MTPRRPKGRVMWLVDYRGSIYGRVFSIKDQAEMWRADFAGNYSLRRVLVTVTPKPTRTPGKGKSRGK